MPKEAKATKKRGKRITQVQTKKQASACSSQAAPANKSAVTKIKYVAGPANNVYSFG